MPPGKRCSLLRGDPLISHQGVENPVSMLKKIILSFLINAGHYEGPGIFKKSA